VGEKGEEEREKTMTRKTQKAALRRRREVYKALMKVLRRP
jgi:hypothetical protein